MAQNLERIHIKSHQTLLNNKILFQESPSKFFCVKKVFGIFCVSFPTKQKQHLPIQKIT